MLKGTMSLKSFLMSFTHCSGVFNIDFEQENGGWDSAVYRSSSGIQETNKMKSL